MSDTTSVREREELWQQDRVENRKEGETVRLTQLGWDFGSDVAGEGGMEGLVG